ncbi:hypothetical protein MMC07_004249 [Pseudocyphellaria aurata]|nr:hypothetical protein [Pseudocyphellaria aurata]
MSPQNQSGSTSRFERRLTSPELVESGCPGSNSSSFWPIKIIELRKPRDGSSPQRELTKKWLNKIRKLSDNLDGQYQQPPLFEERKPSAFDVQPTGSFNTRTPSVSTAKHE